MSLEMKESKFLHDMVKPLLRGTTLTIEFEIIGKPQAKQRPRFGRNGAVYTPQETASYENLVKLSYLQKYDGIQLKTAVSAEIRVEVKIPDSTPKKKARMMLNNEIFPTKKPDCDNIIKSILDALNGVAYSDDKQVIYVSCLKTYGHTDKVKVLLRDAEEGEY